ncbi:MAG: SufD family Fe-S cluster assembly protein [Thermoplasmata archaeon]|nr:SufD family Fe-S cluster assembly protein [Thermoplasmata archaeon]
MAVAVPQYDRWFEERQIEELSQELNDPPEVRRRRMSSFQSFRELPMESNPLYRKYAYFGGVELGGLRPGKSGLPVTAPPLLPHTIRVLHDSSGTRVEVPEELREAGVQVSSVPDLWQHEEAAVALLDPAAATPDKLSSLARALLNRGVSVDVPARCPVAVRLQDISVLSQPAEVISVRRRLRVGAESRLLASEEVYSTAGAGAAAQRLYGSSVQLELADGASAHYLTVHAPDLRAVSLYERTARVDRTGRLAWIWAGFGGFRTRLKMLTVLPGQGSEVDDLQTFYGAGQQAYDSSVQITHQGTDTRGHSITRGLFQNDARGMSRGLVRIEKDARKTVSYLSEHAMLLSRGARSDTVPVLEILCRDVKATHSSSVAPVDPEKVFYLESRGMRRPDAIRMIGEGFLSYVLERAPIAGLRDHLYPALAARWEGHDIVWGPDHFPALPALAVNPTAGSGEWRFDAKLR